MAQKCQKMDKRMRKLETQIKLKANEPDLEDLRNITQYDLQHKASTEHIESKKESNVKSIEDLWTNLLNESREPLATATAEITKKSQHRTTSKTSYEDRHPKQLPIQFNFFNSKTFIATNYINMYNIHTYRYFETTRDIEARRVYWSLYGMWV